ncbi:hypothetical protein CkaCkLH20_01348 [Colletotrichum karsti]|uniref:Uncharacterized protein n=1 Tax=Colletotrichum karsti TaxID=1095194 RepID=A0A9P6ICS0_9PEZI|nr:uncharacterized protein CkaCkLH20_01348 [Colletotrichum karsti]KAF9881198.1 hypothetical protein CkaCkLH20_01348 [Colletotrichum karsti]
MILNTLIFVAALASQPLASLAAPVEPIRDFNAEDWSLINFRRSCAEDQSSCDYSFLITESAANTPKECSFTIQAVDRPAYQTSFSLAKCPGATEYSINGGWNDLGFVTLSVINDKRSLISWFSYKDDTLASGAETGAQKSKVYFHPISVKRDISTKDHHESLAEASDWKLVNVVRYTVNQGTPQETVVVSFSIMSGEENESENVSAEYCFLEVPVVQEDGASSNSFFGRECQQGAKGWQVSWGHNEVTDEVVMTLVNQEKGKQAWFGFNNVSTHVLLGTNGPNPTKELPV